RTAQPALADATPAPGEVRDELGLLLREIAPDGSARSWGYDTGGNTVRVRDFAGAAITCAYESWDLPTRRTDALGRTQLRRFTRTGTLGEVVDTAGVVSGYVRDLKGRVTEHWYGGQLFYRLVYDRADRLVAKLDA